MAREFEAREVLRGYARKSAHIEVNHGCGIRPCYICIMNAPRYQESMPLETIQELHELRGSADGKPMAHDFRGDPLYWTRERWTYAAVAEDALNHDIALKIRTHGGLLGEELPEAAILALVELKNRRRLSQEQLDVTLSVDSYGWIGVDKEVHRLSVHKTAELLTPLRPTLALLHNPNDPENMQEVLDLIRGIGNRFRRVDIVEIGDTGRARTIVPTPPPYEAYEDATSTAFMIDGTILQKTGTRHDQIARVGNIYDLGISKRQ